MASSLLSGVSALRAHQTYLDVVGNNLANLNTTGFKSQRVEFQDLLYQTIQAGGAGSANQVGGVNPIQSGFGAKVASIDSDLQQGSLTTTGRDLDLAIQGNGFFVVSDGTQNLFSRAGAFGLDQANNLVDPATGFRVQRTGSVGEATATSPAFQTPGDNGIKIPFGTGLPGQATSTVTFRGNLSAAATGPQSTTLTSTQPFRAGGVAATTATTLNALDDNSVDYVAGDTLVLQGTTVNGTAVNVSVPVSPTTTLGNLITAINTNFPGATASLDASGNLVVRANNPGPSALNVSIADGAGDTGATAWNNHVLAVTTTGKDGDKVNAAIQVFDTQGSPHTLTLTFQKQSPTVWNLTASLPPGEGTLSDNQVQGITFNDNGSLRGVTGVGLGDGKITFQITGLSTPQTVNFNFGSTNGFDGLTQFGGPSTAAAINQNGFAAGVLSNVTVSQDGVIQGIFSNGQTLAVAQLAVATVSNAGGLDRAGNNYFRLASNSGLPQVGAALAGGRGSIQHGALETSNVDVAQEFTRLIVAQRGFQVNARTISVSDQVLQELANIIR